MTDLLTKPSIVEFLPTLGERIARLEDEKLQALSTLVLYPEELLEVVHASQGYTSKEVADQADTTEKIIKNRRSRMLGAIGIERIPDLSLAVRVAIEDGQIPIKVSRSKSLPSLGQAEKYALALGTLGFTVDETADFASKAPDTIRGQRKMSFGKLSARNMPHATRRMYEVGILRRGEYGIASLTLND